MAEKNTPVRDRHIENEQHLLRFEHLFGKFEIKSFQSTRLMEWIPISVSGNKTFTVCQSSVNQSEHVTLLLLFMYI